MRNTTLSMFLVIVFGTGLFSMQTALLAQEQDEKQHVTADSNIIPADKAQEKPDSKLIVYYFHGRKRCMSCRTIEMYTHDAILEYFPEQIESGHIEWRIENYTNPKNESFKKEFELYTQSVVLVEMVDDEIVRWENLKDVWKLLRNKEAFYEYIHSGVTKFITEG